MQQVHFTGFIGEEFDSAAKLAAIKIVLIFAGLNTGA
jgi:hypothetical protein